MALSEKNLCRKFKSTFRNRPINMDQRTWEDVTVSTKTDANADFTTEREAVLDLVERRLIIEFLDVLTHLKRCSVIHLHSIEETASPTPDTYILKLEGGEQAKFRFNGPAAKSAFVAATTIYSDSGNSSEDSLHE